MVGVVPALLAATGFAAFQVVNRRALSGVDVYRGTAAVLAAGTAVLVVVGVASQDLSLLGEAPVASFAFYAAAGFVHFFCGWTLLGMSQLRIGAARTGVVIGTLPLFGALVAAVALNEPLTGVTLAGLVVVTIGVATVVTTRTGSVVMSGYDAVIGTITGFGTALCWSVSPVLIRNGLQGLPSPLLGAAVGMVASALIYAVAVVLVSHRRERPQLSSDTRRLLATAGVLVALSIWMQWTAYDRAPIAAVLAVLQLTPPLVIVLSTWLAGERLGRGASRVWGGTAVTVAGSLILILRV